MTVTCWSPPAALGAFVAAGLLSAADVHVAQVLVRRTGAGDPRALLGAALAVRAPRLQHVCADLGAVDRLVPDEATTATTPTLPPGRPAVEWPAVDPWREVLLASPSLVRDPDSLDDPATHGAGPPLDVAPLVLAGTRLYLDRLWRDERAVAAGLRHRAGLVADDVDPVTLTRQLDELFDGPAPDRQRLAAATAARRRLSVIAGGPGTGKTTTVARLLALLDAQADSSGRPLPSVALAAPTGKAAQRLTESLRAAAAELSPRARTAASTAVLDRLRTSEATTLHRLLGWMPGNRTRFRHGRGRPLPHDVVVVDETSMVSLALIARLLEALRPDTRLVLLGDPEQLASVEAGSVLGDVVGDATTDPRLGPGARRVLAEVTGADHLAGLGSSAAGGIDDAIVVLDRVHRFRADSGIAALAAAVQRGDADAAVDQLRAGGDLTWVVCREIDQGDVASTTASVTDDDLRPVRETVVTAGTRVIEAARAGDAEAALRHLGDLRVLCGPRRGPFGVESWVVRIEAWLAEDLPWADIRGLGYAGRPVLVTANDHRARLVNGDVGVVVRAAGDHRAVALPALDGVGVRLLSPGRLPASETVHAMTVHKSQGSQFGHVVVVLPQQGSPLLTRELLYTAVTRGRERATIVASEPAVRQAISRRAIRASGLGDALRDA